MSGTITPYETAAGKRYRVRYRKPDKSQTDKRGFKTKREAALFLASVTVTKATGDYIDPARGRATVGILGEAWLITKKTLKRSSYVPLETAWRVYVEPRWGGTEVNRIDPSDVAVWVQAIADGTAPTRRNPKKSKDGQRSASVVIRAVGVLAGILDHAVRDRRISRNPARGLDNLPRKPSKRTRRYLTDDEIVRFARAIDDEVLSVFVVLLAYTGIRWGEAVGLRVRALNFLRFRLLVAENAVEVNGAIVPGEPKSWEKRTVPFPSFLSKPLAKLCEGKDPDHLVFTSTDQGYVRRPKTSVNESSWWLAAVKSAELRHFTPHDLRHTAASLAVSSGANVKAVQRMLGHQSAALTLDTYADLFDDDLNDVADRLNARGLAADVGKVWANAAS